MLYDIAELEKFGQCGVCLSLCFLSSCQGAELRIDSLWFLVLPFLDTLVTGTPGLKDSYPLVNGNMPRLSPGFSDEMQNNQLQKEGIFYLNFTGECGFYWNTAFFLPCFTENYWDPSLSIFDFERKRKKILIGVLSSSDFIYDKNN